MLINQDKFNFKGILKIKIFFIFKIQKIKIINKKKIS